MPSPPERNSGEGRRLKMREGLEMRRGTGRWMEVRRGTGRGWK